MFVRKKPNKSGSISVQVIDKSSGSYSVVKTLGSSQDPGQVDQLVRRAHQWISQQVGQSELDFHDEKQLYASFISSIQQVTVAGSELLLGKLFDQIGFSQINDELFRNLVLSRLCYPVSKLKTTDYLQKYHGIAIDEDAIYRYLDKLYSTQKETVQQISYRHTRKVLGEAIQLVFYDVTTLYFEIDSEDDLRKTGFSKEGKHQHPQIVLGLLVSEGGYPLAYDIFPGNTFEGHTMLPVLDAFKARYRLDKLVIVADSGLLSKANIAELQDKGYEFILGARIKNETQSIKNRILDLSLTHAQSAVIEKGDATRLIISYSDKRARKDHYNRQKGLRKLEKRIKSGKLTKANINNRGYNKYLTLEGDVSVSIDQKKFEADGKWDGLKGYLTNSKLPKDQIIENYMHLWRIERAFRISKTDLKIRPVYHRLQRRIEAHICIAFVAYKIYKELERQLKEKKSDLSPEKAIDIAKTIYAIKVVTPLNKEEIQQTLILNEEQEMLADLFNF
ncbi:MAG: IS1634 family transposase [Candidatus Halalkalibacterium sp. M3_1C_030]